ncbi:hypothetical protein BDW42DRAFT_197520 [Aspergillus taichungensis]|uniref:Uncharacterized protein n=1 Tax=Aspergillus taichungensis TaxID=482145 RepID=A0A2J5HG05_9EURO|nr:hypothetical protein BDW42DRAFT_197520 [Aspergillus taichungensis]
MVQSGANSSMNHPSSSIRGGASLQPTPANNVGGGRGLGDGGWTKGGTSASENKQRQQRQGSESMDQGRGQERWWRRASDPTKDSVNNL